MLKTLKTQGNFYKNITMGKKVFKSGQIVKKICKNLIKSVAKWSGKWYYICRY